MSTIHLTRKGYNYQDKVAILLYLKNLLEKKIFRFYVDKPFGDNSFDAYLVDINKINHIYEIKSGDKFQESKEKISDSLGIFYRHSSASFANTHYYLIVRRDFRGSLTRIWADIDTVKSLSAGTNFNEAKKRLNKDVKIKGVQVNSLIDVLRKLKIDTYYDDNILSDEALVGDIDNLIETTLGIILAKYPTKVHNFDYPISILSAELQMIILRYAGFDEDLHPRFTKAMINYVAHHRMMECYPALPSDRQIQKDRFLNEITSEFIAEYNLDTATPVAMEDLGPVEANVIGKES